jgi:colicin import membrane protein
MKWLAITALGIGLVAMAALGVRRSNATAEAARAAVAKAESEEAAAKSAEKKARDEAAAASARAATAESEAKKAEEQRKAKEAEAEANAAAAEKAKADAKRAEADREKAKEDRARAEAEQRKAEADRDAALAAKETAKLERDKAKAQESEAALKAQLAADSLAAEKLRSEKVVAEAKLREAKMNELADMESELIAWKRDLEEREAALKPEKTIKDLVNLGDGGDETDGKTNAVKLAENDYSLPAETRSLAKADRELRESADNISSAVKSSVVRKLEKLYVEAVRDDRMVDADFYAKELKRMYPDWKYTPPKKEEESK